jgi:hypothetical protein
MSERLAELTVLGYWVVAVYSEFVRNSNNKEAQAL